MGAPLPGLTSAALIGSEPWMKDAACAQVGGDLWFPRVGEHVIAKMARAVCAACPVREQCLQYALRNDERFGIWGGLSEADRARMRTRGAVRRP